MTYLSGKALPRRTFLQGMGATVALPFLDAMFPAGKPTWRMTASARTRAPSFGAPVCKRITSVIWWPMVWIGLRADIGSWKI